MTRYLKTFICIFLALLLLTFTACGRERVKYGDLSPDYEANVKGHITVNYPLATNEEEKLSLSYYAKSFMNKYEGATVNLDFSTGHATARIAAGDIGDVFFMWEDEVYSYAIEERVLMPLGAYLEILDIDLTNVYSGIYKLGEAAGQLYMAARDHTHITLAYNASALDEAGLSAPPEDWSWELFKDYCRQLTKQNDDGTYSQVGATWDATYGPHLIPFLEGWGGEWYDTVNKEIRFVKDERVLQGFAEQINALEEGILRTTNGASSEMSKNYARISMEDSIFNSHVFPGLYQTGLSYEVKGLKWNLANWPVFPVKHSVGTGATGFGVYNRTKRPDTAAAFALYLFTDEGQRAYNGQIGGSVPLTKSLAQDNFWRVPFDTDELNYDAYVSFPEGDTVGKFHSRVPNTIANIITNDIAGVFQRHFSGRQDYTDSLTEIERKATEKWKDLYEDKVNP